MKFALDEYTHLDSPLHRWEPRSKLIGSIAIVFAFAFVEDVRLLPAMLALTAVIYRLSKLPGCYWRYRLRYPGLFLLGVVFFLPFVSGQTILFELGSLPIYEEGCWAVMLIGTRFLSILTIALVLFGTTSLLTMLKTLRSLGLSPILTDMMLLFYRYLFEVGDRLRTMQTAMRLRGFRATRLNRRNLQIFASVAGTLLVQSYEQSERVYNAMRLRGYGQSTAIQEREPVQTKDTLWLAAFIAIAAGFVGAELWL